MSGTDEAFLKRWSRLKRENAEAPAPAPAVPPPPAAAEEKPFRVEDLPPVESLTKDSDYAPFLRAEVPEELRKLALRKLWLSDPALSAVDPLDLHNVDYSFPKVAEVVKTAYRVGKGMVDEAIEAEASGDKPKDVTAPSPKVVDDTPTT
jgi:hypothetical protein